MKIRRHIQGCVAAVTLGALLLAGGCGRDDDPPTPPLETTIPESATAFVSIDWNAVAEARTRLASRLGEEAVSEFEDSLLAELASLLGTRADLKPFFRGFGPRTARWFGGETAVVWLPKPVLLLEHRDRTTAKRRMAALVYFANTNLKAVLEELELDNPFGLDPEQAGTLAGWLSFFDPTFLRKVIDGREIRVLKLPDGTELCWIDTERAVVLGVGAARTLAAAETLERAAAAPPKGDVAITTEDTGNRDLIRAFINNVVTSGERDTILRRSLLEDIVGEGVGGSSTVDYRLGIAEVGSADAEDLGAAASLLGRITLLLKQRIGFHSYQ